MKKRVMEIAYDNYRGGLYEFVKRKNEFPGIAICPVCGGKHMSMEPEILTLSFNHAPVCFYCKADVLQEHLSESDIEFLVESDYYES